MLAELHKVPIWLSRESKAAPCSCYHPSPEWLSEHGFDPKKARAVEITNAATFLAWTHEQPWMVLHELAHAYHHQVLGYDNSTVRAAGSADAAGTSSIGRTLLSPISTSRSCSGWACGPSAWATARDCWRFDAF